MKKKSRDRRKEKRFNLRVMREKYKEDNEAMFERMRMIGIRLKAGGIVSLDLTSDPNGTIAHFDKPGILKD